jgi:hypothetical protein
MFACPLDLQKTMIHFAVLQFGQKWVSLRGRGLRSPLAFLSGSPASHKGSRASAFKVGWVAVTEINPFKALLRSRKFLLLVLDTVVSLALLLIPLAFSLSPAAVDILVKVVALIQPVFVTAIASIAYEDAAEKSSPQNVQVQNVTPQESNPR